MVDINSNIINLTKSQALSRAVHRNRFSRDFAQPRVFAGNSKKHSPSDGGPPRHSFYEVTPLPPCSPLYNELDPLRVLCRSLCSSSSNTHLPPVSHSPWRATPPASERYHHIKCGHRPRCRSCMRSWRGRQLYWQNTGKRTKEAYEILSLLRMLHCVIESVAFTNSC